MITRRSTAGLAAAIGLGRTAAAQDARPWRHAIVWLLFLGPFFFAT